MMWENRLSLGWDIPRDMNHVRLLLRLGQTAPVDRVGADSDVPSVFRL